MWAPNCDWVGNDIGYKTTPNDRCGEACLNRPDCTHFTWSTSNGGTCFMKGANNAPELKGATSGICGYLTQNSATNPYSKTQQFLNNEYNIKVAKSIQDYILLVNPNQVQYANSVVDYPTAIWIDSFASLLKIPVAISQAITQTGETQKVPFLLEFVIYNLPGRDCQAYSSQGEIEKGNINMYKSFIDSAYESLQHSKAWLSLIIEPNSLSNLATKLGVQQCDSQTEKDYMEGVSYAIAKFSSIPNTYLYLDAGHGGSLGWPEGMKKSTILFKNVLTAAKNLNPNSIIRGFASNVANYNPFSSTACPATQKCPLLENIETNELNYNGNPGYNEDLHTRRFSAYLSAAGLPSRWIVDTSRSGRSTIRTDWGAWCNVHNAGIGERPQAEPFRDDASSPVDAFVWIKPPGESDGASGVGVLEKASWYNMDNVVLGACSQVEPLKKTGLDRQCNPNDDLGRDAMPNAPQAGEWFNEQFLSLVEKANPGLPEKPFDLCSFDDGTLPYCPRYCDHDAFNKPTCPSFCLEDGENKPSCPQYCQVDGYKKPSCPQYVPFPHATVFVHQINTVGAVGWAISQGANGIETDIQFENSIPKTCLHGGLCDCTCKCANGDTCPDDDVCKALWDFTGSHCGAEETVEELFTEIGDPKYHHKLAVIYIDTKLDKNVKDLSLAGRSVVQLLNKKVFSRGYRGQVVISGLEDIYKEYLVAAIEEAKLSDFGDRYYYTFDNHGSEAEKVWRELSSLGTRNIVYSTGTSACWDTDFLDAIRYSTERDYAGVTIWTLDEASLMERYLNNGALMIMTNKPSRAVSVVQTNGKTLATPGKALAPGMGYIRPPN